MDLEAVHQVGFSGAPAPRWRSSGLVCMLLYKVGPKNKYQFTKPFLMIPGVKSR